MFIVNGEYIIYYENTRVTRNTEKSIIGGVYTFKTHIHRSQIIRSLMVNTCS